MKAFITAVRELWGLFVEDASFTVAMIACVTLAIVAFPRASLPPAWRGPLLFCMLAAVLLENVCRSARH